MTGTFVSRNPWPFRLKVNLASTVKYRPMAPLQCIGW